MIRLGLCCQFIDVPINFRSTTAAFCARQSRALALAHLAQIAEHNADALVQSIEYCARHGVGAFRINSQILPVKTHPEVGYALDDLPGATAIRRRFEQCRTLAEELGVRLTFHPDQFVVLNSPRPDVVAHSIAELEYQAEVAEWVGADVINLHAGGVYRDKSTALDSLRRVLQQLSDRARSRLTLENDDKNYTPRDLLPLCRAEQVPLVYDVHHHRCRGDGLSIEAATDAALGTWPREPLFHLSSPIEGWRGPAPQRHHDFIDPHDFPACWESLDLTVEVEAKAKELAVARLARALARRGVALWPGAPLVV